MPQNEVNLDIFAHNLSFERAICGIYYKGICKAIEKSPQLNGINELFEKVKQNVPNSNLMQMIFCIKIFNEIGVLNYSFKDLHLCIKENKNVHTNLENSHTYTNLRKIQEKNILEINR